MIKINVDSVILVIDDSSFARAGLGGALKKMGFRRVREVASAEQALEDLELETVGIIFCDQVMPGMTGTEFLHKLRRNQGWEAIPFILVTGQVNATVVAEMADYGGDAVVVKPYSPQTLEDKINEAIRSRWFHLGLSAEQAEETIQQVKGDLSGKRAYLFETQTRLDPKDPRVKFAEGVKAQKEGDTRAARDLFLQVVGSQPRFLKAREALADIYGANGEADKALEHLKIAVEINPSNHQRRYDLAKLMMDLKRNDEAAEVLSLMLADGCRYPELLMRVGRALDQLGRKEEAAKAFGSSLDNQPNNPEGWRALAGLYRDEVDPARYMAVLAQAAKSMPQNSDAQWQYARALDKQDRKKEAWQVARALLDMDAGHKQARELLDKLEPSLNASK